MIIAMLGIRFTSRRPAIFNKNRVFSFVAPGGSMGTVTYCNTFYPIFSSSLFVIVIALKMVVKVRNKPVSIIERDCPMTL
jgi:hypothetical protein